MKKLSYIIWVLLLASCSKVLDQTPQDKITEDNFYKTASDAEAAAVGIYPPAQLLAQQSPVAFEAGSDLTTGLLINYSPFSQHAIPVDNSIVESYWQNNYAGIGRCNDLLHNVAGMDSTLFSVGQKARILGEAYFLRAYYYFNLVKAYGDVPLVTVPYASFNVDFTIARTPAAKVFDQIVADLKIAELSLPASYPANVDTRGRATQGGAKALLSKVYLGLKNYTGAASEALDVMNNSTYALATGSAGYSGIFSANSKNGTEAIFEIQYVNSTSQSNGLHNLYVPGSPPSGIQPGSYQIAPTSKIINAFEVGDIRKAASIGLSSSTVNPVSYVNKFLRLTSGAEPDIIALRLADIILVRAEALNNLGQTDDAIAALNIIRRRAFGLSLTAATSRDYPSANDLTNGYTLTQAIENERMKELCFEGHRFYDLVRTGRAQAVLGIAANKTLWPVPLRDIQTNPRLIQNDGY